MTERLWALTDRQPSQADRAKAALHLLDWLGCALAGAATNTGQSMLRILSDGNAFTRAGPSGALAMGGLGSLLEMDDVHRTALLHPGPVVIPAVLASAGNAAASTVLDAILVGYEAMIRLGSAVGPGHYARFHNTGTCGGIGAAAGAARVMGLTVDQAVSAMGHAMSTAGGLWQARNEPVMTKHLHVAEAARRGVQAAELAKGGLAGPRFILEGPQGFFAGMAPDGWPDLVTAPAAGWKIAEVSFKPWPACRHAHPAIDAALLVRDRLAGRSVKTARIETYADAVTFCDKPTPRTEAEAKFSLQHALAVVLLRGRPSLADFADTSLDAVDVQALRARTDVAADAQLTAAYPSHFGARVSVVTDDGETVANKVIDAWGDPENPMDQQAVTDKFKTLAHAAGVPDGLAAELIGAVFGLADSRPLADLRQALARLNF
jgi:2-methylcitrate dehydratase PrpD